MTDIHRFYDNAKNEVERQGFSGEIEYTKGLHFEGRTAKEFFYDYAFVVISSGMKNQVAEGIYERFCRAGGDPDRIGHPGKRAAVHRAREEYPSWFYDLQQATDKVTYLETLPWIGPITKYHLARNIGLDVAKPDRHLVRLAERFRFNDVQAMCQSIAEKTGDRIGVVDVILWRYCNLNPSHPNKAGVN